MLSTVIRPEKAIAAKILHDLASPITALSFIAEDNPEIHAVTEDMIWRLRTLRYLFVSDSFSRADIHPFISHVQNNLDDEKYNRLLLILGYMFKNKAIRVEKDGHELKFSAIIEPAQFEDQNILFSCLKEEIRHLNLTTQMI